MRPIGLEESSLGDLAILALETLRAREIKLHLYIYYT